MLLTALPKTYVSHQGALWGSYGSSWALPLESSHAPLPMSLHALLGSVSSHGFAGRTWFVTQTMALKMRLMHV